LRVIACIEERWLIAKVLGHIQPRAALDGIKARGPPRGSTHVSVRIRSRSAGAFRSNVWYHSATSFTEALLS
jgi:hypothetical protein